MNLRSLRLKIKDKLRVENDLIREFLAEFQSTFVLISLGCALNAQATLSRSTHGGFLSINIGWGWAAAMGIWTAAGVSGGHMNPAVTLANVALGRLKLVKMPIYFVAQYVAAFTASACVYGVYYEALNNFDGGIRSVTGENATAGIWATYPQPYLSTLAAFSDQVFGTMLLLVGVLALTDRFNSAPGSGMFPMGIGGLVTLIGLAFGYNCGAAINPARDFGPRLFTAVAGWGVEVFTVYNYFFWVPLVAPHIGGVCGAWLYQVLVGIQVEPIRTAETDNTSTKENGQQNPAPSEAYNLQLRNPEAYS